MAAGVSSIMVGHINVGQNKLGEIWAQNIAHARLLGEEIGWDGIITTDALDMQAIIDAESAGEFACSASGNCSRFRAGDAARTAFAAGADIILMPAKPLDTIKALSSDSITAETQHHVATAVRRIRKLKQFVELLPAGRADSIRQPQLFTGHMELALETALAATEIIPPEGSVLLPLPADLPLAAFSILQSGEDFRAASRFFTMLGQAVENDCDYAYLDENITSVQLADMAAGVDDAQLLIFALFYRGRGYSRQLAAVDTLNHIIGTLAAGRPVILICFGDPFVAPQLTAHTKILTYSDSFASLAAAVCVVSGRGTASK